MRLTQILFLIFVISIPFLFSFDPISFINIISPSNHYGKKTDIAYGEFERQKLDIYIPNYLEEVNKNSTVVVYFHGGGWEFGDKKKYKFIASRLTKEGYIVIIPNYRVYPNAVFPAFVEDAALAVAWIKKNLNNYAIHTKNIYLMGHSAGAHIASLLTSDKRYFDRAGVNGEDIAGFIGMAGPYNFLPLTNNKRKKIFPKKLRFNSQPINFVDGIKIPYLLLHGVDDMTVLPRNSKTLAEKILSTNGNVTLKLYEDTNHREIIMPFVPGFRNYTPTLHDIVNFINYNNK